MKLYTVMDVSRILHISKDNVYRLIYSGQLKAVRLPASKHGLRITEAALKEFLQEAQWVKQNSLNGSASRDRR